MAQWARRNKRRRYNWAFMLAGAHDEIAESAPVASPLPSEEQPPSAEPGPAAGVGVGAILEGSGT